MTDREVEREKMFTFEFDKGKEAVNVKKHDVSFHEATTVFFDRQSLTFYDPDHSDEEDRFVTMGIASTGRLLFVSHADRGNAIRIISAREATRGERSHYEKENR